MNSVVLLVHICVVMTATIAIVQDVYAASGGKIVIPLDTRLEHTSGVICNKYTWTFLGSGPYIRRLAGGKENCIRDDCTNETRPRCSLSGNGSLQLYDVKPDDAGEYTIATYHISRAKNTEVTFNLHVLDAVSQPDVSLLCLADGQPVISCFAVNGTKISTSIISNGELLLKKSVSEGYEKYFTVSSSAPWNVSCSISNKISQKTTNVLYNMCPVTLSEPSVETLCHPDGSLEISCKTENGSEPSLSWFIDGNPVPSTSLWKVTENLLSGSTNVAVNVSCSARNAISSVQSPVATVTCLAPAPHLTAHVVCKILVFVLFTVLLISMIRDLQHKNEEQDL
ncbi:T-cell surface antigen CD2 [Rhinoderma darwinii]|uniref:T-cell surface antigen CD2 n=1 Tax=Rhinoderma darwinii TaxID=43563 RepID=UPI003F664747